MATVRKAYGERIPVVVNIKPGSGKTKQAFRSECDINNIMRRYKASGVLPVNKGLGTYGDFANVGDFLECQNKVLEARKHFASLPSKVRGKFKNDVAGLLEFVQDPANRAEAVELGLIDEKLEKLEVVKDVVVRDLEAK